MPLSQVLFSPCLCSAPREEDDEPSESPSIPQTPSTVSPEPPIKPRLGELTVTDATPDSLSLFWTIPEGQFDHFLIQYKNGDGQPKVVRVPGDEDEVTISGLEPDHKYKMNLYGFHDRQRVGPVSVIGVTSEWTVETPGWDLVGRSPPQVMGAWGVGGPSPRG